jgi:hypothetical protein
MFVWHFEKYTFFKGEVYKLYEGRCTGFLFIIIVATTFADFVWVIDSKFNFLFEITYFCVALLT